MADDNVQNTGITEISYTSVYEHIFLIFKTQWKSFVVSFIAIFGFLWTFIEAISYLKKLDLSNDLVLYGCLLISLFGAISKITFGVKGS